MPPIDLNTLASNLRAQAAANSTIVLDASVFADERVREGIRSAFALPSDSNLTIDVKTSDIPDPTAEGVLTISTAKASVLKQTDLPVRLIFTTLGGALQAIISFEMASSWKFSASFKGLDGSPFNLLETSGAHFVYTTVEQSHFAWPNEPSTPIDLETGLNFLSNVTIKHFPALLNLLKPVIGDASLSLKMWGPFAPAEGQDLPVGKLRAPLHSGNTFVIGVNPIELTLGAPAIAVQIGKTSDDFPVQPIDLLVEADFQQRLKVAIAIPATGGALELSTTPLPHDTSINALIGSLPGGQIFTDFATHLPAELTSVFANVALKNFALRVSPKPAVSYVGLSVSTANPWTVISGVLVLEGVRLEIQTIEPTDLNLTRVQIEATAGFLPNIFTGRFDFVVELERQTSWTVKTISGAYYGSVNLGTLVGKLIDNESVVPSALKGIQFSDFGVRAIREAESFNYSFYGSAEASFPILDDLELTSVLNLVVDKTPSGYKIDLVGGLVIGEQVFSISLNLGQAGSKLKATWKKEGTPLGFGDIANAFGWDEMPPLPEGLDLALKDVEFTYDFKKKTVVLTAHSANYGEIVFASLSLNGNRVYVFSVDIPLNLKFSQLPLLGESLRTDTPVGVDELQIIVASEVLKETDKNGLDALINGKPLIPKSLAKGITIAAKLQMNGPHEIVLPLTGGAKKVQEESLPHGGIPAGELAPGESARTSLTAPSYQAEPKWFNLQKTLGPVHFEKVGVQYQGSTLRFLLNAALSAAGLTLSVEDLSVGSPLKKFEPQFELRGLGIDYKAGDIQIGGAFLRTVKDGRDSYDGAAVIKTKQMALSALGSYTKLNGEPSLFIYAFLDYPLGGPSFFFVTGLAAGFGYNRRLIAPSIDNVANFPLITQAMGGKQAAPKSLVKALESLQDYVPPGIGNIFLAVGVKFNSFKLIDSFALLTVEFGNSFAINLLGVSKAVVPTPEAGKAVTPLAQVEIAWKATFNPDDGCLGIDARLTPNSYILSKECRLSGGYAFYSWFSGPHAGDFVQTLGGYHPNFTIPAHYPKVPRLAFDWRVSSSLTIQGQAYYALTGSALMAGGYLEVLFRQGELRAWLKAEANFLIAWKPYHYDAYLSVNVGASYTFDIDLLFGHVRVTISVDVGAQLHLWGPDFSGTARIDLSVISFTIGFGAGASQSLPPLKEWTNFQQSFLPAKDVCSISVKDGLVRNIEAAGKERWVINPKQFSLVVDSAIPFKSASSVVGGKNTLVKDANVEFGVGPMAVSAANLISNLTVIIKKRGSDPVDGKFNYSVINKKVPAGLWGQTAVPNLNGDTFLDNVPAGIEITPGEHPAPGETATIDLKAFTYSEGYYPKGEKGPDGHAYDWEPAGSFVPSPDAREAEARRKAIRDGVATNPGRASLLKELGVTVNVNIRGTVADDFVSAPQIGTL
jgi:hypothetical protein